MSESDVALSHARQAQDSPATGQQASVAPMNGSNPGLSSGKRKAILFTALNLATLAFIIAWLAFDWYAIAYLISH